MVNLDDFIRTKRNDELSAVLIEYLKEVPDCDDDLILAVLVYTKNDDDKKAIIKYIQAGEEVTYEQVLLNALWLKQQRNKISED